MTSLKNLRSALKKGTAIPKWVLCVDMFPSWVSSNYTWASNERIPVQTSNIKLTQHNNKISISFFEFNSFDRLNFLLSEWSNRTHNPVTNEYGSPADLRLHVRLIDESDALLDQRLILRHPETPIITSTQTTCIFYCDFEND